MSSEPFQSSFGVFSKRWQSSWTSFRGALQSNFNAVWGHLRSNCISQDWTILNQFPNQSKVAILISYDFVAVSITRHWKSSLRAIWKQFESVREQTRAPWQKCTNWRESRVLAMFFHCPSVDKHTFTKTNKVLSISTRGQSAMQGRIPHEWFTPF